MGAKVSKKPDRSPIQKIEAAGSSETLLLIYQITRRHLSEDRYLNPTLHYVAYKNNNNAYYMLAECRTTNALIN
jgi:hypothetical protein